MIDALQTTLAYGGSFLLVLGVVVFVHEFGHYAAARACKMAIATFSIGFGRTLFSWKDKIGVSWKVGALPIGGYVRFEDDADPASATAKSRYETPEALADARAKGLYHAQPVQNRAFVSAAGPGANFIFAIVAFASLMMIVGRDSATIDEVAPNSPAAAAGLQAGDVVRAVDGQEVKSFREFQSKIAARPGATLSLTVERNDTQTDIAALVGSRAMGEGANARQIGFLGITHTGRPFGERVGPVEAFEFGAEQTWAIIAGTGIYVADIIRGRQSADQLAGPLGILHQSGEITTDALKPQDVPASKKIVVLMLRLLEWAAILSVAVGVANLLPIPILDGGNLLFYAIEFVRGGKPLPLIAQEWALRAGIAAMGALFLFATWNDIQRFLG